MSTGRRQASDIWKEDVERWGGLPKCAQCAQAPIFQVTVLDRKCFGAYNSSHEKLWMEESFPRSKSFFPFLLVPFFLLLIFCKAMNKRRKKLKEKEKSIY